MKLFFIAISTALAIASAQFLSNEYLPPAEECSGASRPFVETNFLENEPSHSLTDDGYRYKIVKRFRLRQRRDISELTNNYLPPIAVSVAAEETAPISAVYSAPSAGETYEVEASEPAPASAHSFANDGYRYRSVKRYRLRSRY